MAEYWGNEPSQQIHSLRISECLHMDEEGNLDNKVSHLHNILTKAVQKVFKDCRQLGSSFPLDLQCPLRCLAASKIWLTKAIKLLVRD